MPEEKMSHLLNGFASADEIDRGTHQYHNNLPQHQRKVFKPDRHAGDVVLNGTAVHVNGCGAVLHHDDTDEAHFPPRPCNVGIVDMELYLPPCYVDQEELELFDIRLSSPDKLPRDSPSPGRNTKGLGQRRMGVCIDREDIVSISKTVVDRLMRRQHHNKIGYERIGRLEVGTETLIDKSKSIKTCLMDLFEKSGNFNVEGTDCLNACYGGTQALFNAVNWIESSAWDGRFAIVVAADIAVYQEGAARCTGGAGAVALLIGADAPIVVDQRFRSTCARHVWDFYKPNLASEFPLVDGPASVACYLAALDDCYLKFNSIVHRNARQWHAPDSHFGKKLASVGATPNLDWFNHIIFHAPYCKLVQKSVARMKYLDGYEQRRRLPGRHVGETNNISAPNDDEIEKMFDLPLNKTYTNKLLGKFFEKESEQVYLTKTEPSLFLARDVGNMYTASVFACIISLLSTMSVETDDADDDNEEKAVVFSYGSGMIASIYLLRLRTSHPKFAELCRYFSKNELQKRLNRMQRISPEQFTDMLNEREALLTLPRQLYSSKLSPTAPAINVSAITKKVAELPSFTLSPSPPAGADGPDTKQQQQQHVDDHHFVPKSNVDILEEGSFYLTHIDVHMRRYYAQKLQ